MGTMDASPFLVLPTVVCPLTLSRKLNIGPAGKEGRLFFPDMCGKLIFIAAGLVHPGLDKLVFGDSGGQAVESQAHGDELLLDAFA